jgi:hypothetical protein
VTENGKENKRNDVAWRADVGLLRARQE